MYKENILTIMALVLLSIVLASCSTDLKVLPSEENNEALFQYEYKDTQDQKENNDETSRTPVIERVYLSNINHTTSITKFLNTGNIIDVYSDDIIIMKLELKEVLSGDQALISINNQKSQIYQEETKIRVREPYMIEIKDIIFNEDKLKAGIFLNILSENKESYPSKLIEEDLGLHRYVSSKKEKFHQDNNLTFDKFTAEYGNAVVEVFENVKFSTLYQDNRKIKDYKDNRIYVLEDEEIVAWVSFLENTGHIIKINGYYDSIIETYLKKYPSHMTTKTLCDKDIFLEENDSWVEYFDESEFLFKIENIDPANMDVNLRINNADLIMSQKDHINIDNNIIILDEIEIDSSGMHRVKLCLS